MNMNRTNVTGARTQKLGFVSTYRTSIALLSLAAAATPVFAASINYGNFGPVVPGVQFLGVTESSGTDPVPMYGPPAPFATGLDFDPIGFVSTSTGGAPDITDGQLNLTIRTDPGVGVNAITLFETGDFTLAGLGTPATAALAGSIMRVTVTELDGVDVAPISLAPVNGSVGFGLPPSQIVQPWSLGLTINVAAQLQNISDKTATEVEVVIDNTLVSLSEILSTSLISKKDFRLSVNTTGTLRTFNAVDVPETGSTVWLLGGGIGLVLLGHRSVGKLRFA
jgi:hypothetical protein